MSKPNGCFLLFAAAGMLPAASPSLFIAPVEQSSLAGFETSTLAQLNGSSVGGRAKALVVASDYRTAYVTATAEGSVWQIDITTGEVLQVLPTGPNPVALGLNPDGTTLYVLTSARESHLLAFDTATGAQIGTAAAGEDSTSLAVSPDGAKVYVSSLLQILDFSTSTLKITATVPVGAATMAFGPSSRVLYAAPVNLEQVVEIDTATDSLITTISTGSAAISGLAASADGSYLYAASSQGLLQIATATNRIVNDFDAGQAFFGVALSPGGSTALCLGVPTVSIHLASANSRNVPLNGYASAAAFTPNGAQFYVLIGTTFDVDYASESTDQLKGAVSAVPGNYWLAASSSGNKVGAISSDTGRVSLIDAASQTVDQTYLFQPSMGLAGLALNSTGTEAFFPAGNSSTLEILDLKSGAAKLVAIPGSGTDIDIAVSPDDNTAYVVAPQLCSVDLATAAVKQCGATITLAYTGLLRTLALNSTGTRIFAIGASSVGEYDASSLQLLRTVNLATGENAVGLVYSAATDSLYVIGTDTTNGTGVVVRVDAGSLTSVANALTAPLSDIAVGPDGKQVYLAGHFQEIVILDGTTLTPIGSIGQVQASSLVSAQ